MKHSQSEERKMKFIFLASLARSGSTLLSFYMAAHPQIATVSELTGLIPTVDVNTYMCSCGQRIVECDFWKEVGQCMQEKGYHFQLKDFDTHIYTSHNKLMRMLQVSDMRNPFLNDLRDKFWMNFPPTQQQLKTLVDRNVVLAKIVMEITQKPVFLDASKAHHRVKYLQRFSDLDLRVIHLVRDPRGVVASWQKNSEQSHLSIAQTAQIWHRRNLQIERTLQSFQPDKKIRVRYEDFCADPLATLQQISTTFGLEVPTTMPEIDMSKYHLVGNAMRTRGTIHIKRDERWKEQLTEQQIQEINLITADVAKRYQYN